MSTMGSNRPFFSNFLAAFRAHSAALPKSSASISTTSSAAAAAAATSQTVWSSATTASSSSSSATQTSSETSSSSSAPRAINAKSGSSHHHNQQTALSPLQHNVSPLTHGPRSPPSSGIAVGGGMPVYGPPNKPPQNYPTPQEARRNRRGSDSSSEGGYRDALGGEKWYIGGRTAGGEERYYKLSMVHRDTSADRLSADRLSL